MKQQTNANINTLFFWTTKCTGKMDDDVHSFACKKRTKKKNKTMFFLLLLIDWVCCGCVHTIKTGDVITSSRGLAIKYCKTDSGPHYQTLRTLNSDRRNEPNAIGPISDSFRVGDRLFIPDICTVSFGLHSPCAGNVLFLKKQNLGKCKNKLELSSIVLAENDCANGNANSVCGNYATCSNTNTGMFLKF